MLLINNDVINCDNNNILQGVQIWFVRNMNLLMFKLIQLCYCQTVKFCHLHMFCHIEQCNNCQANWNVGGIQVAKLMADIDMMKYK